MSAWQLFSDAGSSFRWESLLAEPEVQPNGVPIQRHDTPPCLPSMADLLLQGCSKFLENRSESIENAPMFRTGSGKSVTVKRSSVSRALSVLGDDDATDAGQVRDGDNACSLSTSLFQTGSGKMVGIPSARLVKAKALLGLQEDKDEDTFQNLQFTRKPSTSDEPRGWCDGDNEGSFSNSLFQTGMGKMVGVSSAGIVKAKTLLGLQEDNDNFMVQRSELTMKPFTTNEPCGYHDGGNLSTSLFQTGSGKMVGISSAGLIKAKTLLGLNEDNEDCIFPSVELTRKHSSINESCGWHDRDNGYNLSTPPLQTGSGKMVGISSAGLVKAKTLLGLQEGNDDCIFQNVKHSVKRSTANESCGWQNLSHLEAREGIFSSDTSLEDAATTPKPSLVCNENNLCDQTIQSFIQSEKCNPVPKPSPIKFHTAGGRSISVSTDALQRARSLLGDPELGGFLNEGDAEDFPVSFSKEKISSDNTSSNTKDDHHASMLQNKSAKRKFILETFISPVHLSSNRVCSSTTSENIVPGSNLMKKFDAVDCSSARSLSSDIHSLQKSFSNRVCASKPETNTSQASGIASRDNSPGISSGRPLCDISNTIGTGYTNNIQGNTKKRRFGRQNSVSPFKRPRSSKFSTPLKSGVSLVPNGLSTLSSGRPIRNRRVFARYPFQRHRMYLKEYFGVPPLDQNMVEHLSDQVKQINCKVAESYSFLDESGSISIGAEDFCHMLIQSGASMQFASTEWVLNHYKWIVWKLACYERCYPAKCAGKFLTVSNVLEELKYRYEREVNHGHRSAIKRILEGDASPSLMLVLCISAIHLSSDTDIKTSPPAVNGTENSNTLKVELTDGWYSVNALLDVLLSKQLATGKIFVGQKLRIWGATLCGWAGPVSPLEASSTVSLLLHMNGTYRAHWADKLGFCKDIGAPLAFRLIKGNGGPVSRTILGVTRIYPVLYKERLSSGGSVVRSERMETQMMQLYNQRCSLVVEGVISDCQRGISGLHDDSDSEEGAKIFKLLETAAEPEVLMAEMSSEQLSSFASYQAKQEAMRQSDMEKLIGKALGDAGLTTREVTAFMRIRVVGLTNETYQGKSCRKEGIITIWSPTEKQKNELVEGQAYVFSGLTPVNSDSDMLYLQARGSTTKWQPLSPLAVKNFKPFFIPRKSVLLSDLGDVPLSSEFDIAAYVVHVGEVYTAAHQKKQWVFVADGSISELQSEASSNSLLAISFCSPYTADSFTPVNHNLVGSTVGFCNLIKRAKDQMNNLWVAEATENSTYIINFDSGHCSHLKNAAGSAERWAKISNLTIEKLKENVLFIIGDCKN